MSPGISQRFFEFYFMDSFKNSTNCSIFSWRTSVFSKDVSEFLHEFHLKFTWGFLREFLYVILQEFLEGMIFKEILQKISKDFYKKSSRIPSGLQEFLKCCFLEGSKDSSWNILILWKVFIIFDFELLQ